MGIDGDSGWRDAKHRRAKDLDKITSAYNQHINISIHKLSQARTVGWQGSSDSPALLEIQESLGRDWIGTQDNVFWTEVEWDIMGPRPETAYKLFCFAEDAWVRWRIYLNCCAFLTRFRHGLPSKLVQMSGRENYKHRWQPKLHCTDHTEQIVGCWEQECCDTKEPQEVLNCGHRMTPDSKTWHSLRKSEDSFDASQTVQPDSENVRPLSQVQVLTAAIGARLSYIVFQICSKYVLIFFKFWLSTASNIGQDNIGWRSSELYKAGNTESYLHKKWAKL